MITSQPVRQCVYFALLEPLGIIKIGRSTKPGDRDRNLRYEARCYFGSDSTVKWLAIIPGNPEIEHFYHQKFRHHLIRGQEWFSAHQEIFEFAASQQSMKVSDFYKQRNYRAAKRSGKL